MPFNFAEESRPLSDSLKKKIFPYLPCTVGLESIYHSAGFDAFATGVVYAGTRTAFFRTITSPLVYHGSTHDLLRFAFQPNYTSISHLSNKSVVYFPGRPIITYSRLQLPLLGLKLKLSGEEISNSVCHSFPLSNLLHGLSQISL